MTEKKKKMFSYYIAWISNTDNFTVSSVYSFLVVHSTPVPK